MNSPPDLRGPGSDKERFDRAIAYVNGNDIAFVVPDIITTAVDWQ
tara:strand:+ start:6461 stop:6595 length:135 start_codon:yes stop_codon:yes gene_type:complete